MADTINEINKLTDPPRMSESKILNPKFILVITGIFSLFLIIAAAIPSSVKSNSYLVVGLFICFILKTIYDIIKLIKTFNYSYNDVGNKFTKYFEYIIPICAILYLVMFVIFFHMFYIILPNKESPCLSRILNLKIFAFSLTFFIIGDAYFLYSNKPEYYIISIALYTLMGMGLMLHYKKSVINLHNKLNDNCQEESVK
jgi:hypothetical protein